MLKKLSIILLCIVLVITISFFYKNKDDNQEIIFSTDNMVAIMEEQADGSFKQSDKTTWPSGLYYDASKSGCVDINGNIINDVSLRFSSNKIYLETEYSLKCYLYFKKTNTKLDFSLSSGTNTSITHERNVTATLSWNIDNAKRYCFSSSDSQTACSWNPVGSTKSVSQTVKLEGSNGVKKYYAYLEDNDGNVTQAEASITLDIAFDLSTICSSSSLSSCLASKSSEISSITNLNANKGGMYRYQGTTVNNNYICFGTNTKSTCTSNVDKYMYRIIGITSSGELKLIKETVVKESSNVYFQWHTTNYTSATWPNSSIFKRLNGTSNGSTSGATGNTNIFIGNSYYDYLSSSTWINKITNHSWKYGDTTPDADHYTMFGYNGDTAYAYENAWSSTTSAKIGLMYIHDYYYAYGSTAPGTEAKALSSWIHFRKDGYNTSSNREWLMSRSGDDRGYWDARWIVEAGSVNRAYVTYSDDVSVRPVFFVTSSAVIQGGTGTKSDPYLLKS